MNRTRRVFMTIIGAAVASVFLMVYMLSPDDEPEPGPPKPLPPGSVRVTVASELWIAEFERWGYSTSFLYLIGGLEVLAAIALLIPRTAIYGASLIFFIMLAETFYRCDRIESFDITCLGIDPEVPSF